MQPSYLIPSRWLNSDLDWGKSFHVLQAWVPLPCHTDWAGLSAWGCVCRVHIYPPPCRRKPCSSGACWLLGAVPLRRRELQSKGSLLPCVPDLAHRATAHEASHKICGGPVGWITWWQGPDLAHGLGVEYPWSKALCLGLNVNPVKSVSFENPIYKIHLLELTE